MDNPSIALSFETSLEYVLRESGVHGRLTVGRVERIGREQLNVYDEHGALLDYLSGTALRTWCVIDVRGVPLEGWSVIQPLDRGQVGSQAQCCKHVYSMVLSGEPFVYFWRI